MRGIARRHRHRHGQIAPLAVHAEHRQDQPPAALRLGRQARAQIARQPRQPVRGVLHRLGQPRRRLEAGRRLGRGHRLGQPPHRLVQPDQRVVARLGPAEPAHHRQPRHRGQIADGPQPQPPQKQQRVPRQPQRRDRQGGKIAGVRADHAFRPVARKPPCRAARGGHGHPRGQPRPREARLHVGQHRRLAAMQMRRARGIHHQPVAPVGSRPRPPAPRPQHQPIQRRGFQVRPRLLDPQGGADRAHVGDARADLHARQPRGPVRAVDHRPVPPLDR